MSVLTLILESYFPQLQFRLLGPQCGEQTGPWLWKSFDDTHSFVSRRTALGWERGALSPWISF